MSATADDLKILLPEFKDVPNDTVTLWITQACCFVDPNYWGDKADFATCLYAAHLMIYVGGYDGGQANGNVSTGPLRRERVGDLEREYGVSTSPNDENALLATNYGRQFIELRKTLVVTPRVIGCRNLY